MNISQSSGGANCVMNQNSNLMVNLTSESLFDYKRKLLKTLSKFGVAHTIPIA